MALSRSEIIREFAKGRGCAQCVLGEYADHFDYDMDETDKFTACFSGGMFHGGTCGAVTGALMVIGLASDTMEEQQERTTRFLEMFKERHGSLLCEDHLNLHPFVLEEANQILAEGKTMDICPAFLQTAYEFLDEMLDD